MKRIVIADDHEVVRSGLRAIVETRSDWIVSGEATNGEQAVALARAGIDVQVHEQAQQLTEVGAGVSLAPNGLRMLERLGDGINHSVAAQRLVNGFDISTIPELMSVPDAPLITSNGGGLLAAIVFTVFMLFVTGGIIATYVRDEKPQVLDGFPHAWRM